MSKRVRRMLMREVVSPPACESMPRSERIVMGLFEAGLVFLVVSLISAVLRMCEP